jgi:hypothetical protein
LGKKYQKKVRRLEKLSVSSPRHRAHHSAGDPPANPTLRARSSLINPCSPRCLVHYRVAGANRGRSRRPVRSPRGHARLGGARPTLSLLQANRGAGTAPPATLGVAESTAEMDRNLRPQLRAVVVGKTPTQVLLRTCTYRLSHSHPVISPTRVPRLPPAETEMRCPHCRR